MKKRILVIGVIMLCLPAFAFAADKPTPAEAKKVVEYYFNGQGKGAVLADYKLCKDVHREGENRNECTDVITNKNIKKGDKVLLWMKFLVPSDDKASIVMTCKNEGQVRRVIDTEVTGSLRYRVWRIIPTDRAGSWTIDIVEETASGDVNLGTVSYTVVE